MNKNIKFKPLSKEFLLKRGYCCNNTCSNCPYKKTNTKNNMIFKDQKLNELQSKCVADIGLRIKTIDEATEELIKSVVGHCGSLCDGHADWVPVDNEECKDYILNSINLL